MFRFAFIAAALVAVLALNGCTQCSSNHETQNQEETAAPPPPPAEESSEGAPAAENLEEAPAPVEESAE